MKKFNIFSLIVFFVNYFLFSLEIPVPKNVHSIVCADVNLDNFIDIIIGSSQSSSQHDSVTILENNGYGEFNKITFEKNNMHTLKCVDFNGDNLPDIVTKVFDSYDIVYYANNGDFAFGEQNVIHSTLTDHKEKINIADMDNDADNDLVFYLHNTDAYWGICKNVNGQFSEEVYYNNDGIISNLSIGKLNNDNFADILIGRNFGVQLFYNYFPDFEEVIVDSFFSEYSFIEDMDNNGYNDLVLLYSSAFTINPSLMKIVYNFGDDTFIEGDTLPFPSGILIRNISDFNNDNFPDLVYDDFYRENIYICFNNQDGTFNEPYSYNIDYAPLGYNVASADFDNNGFLDLAVSKYYIDDENQGVKILFNNGIGGFEEEPQVGIEDQCLSNEKTKLSNYPNPFNPTTSIHFSIDVAGFIELRIYDMKGRLIKKLVNKKLERSEHYVVWNGNDENNQTCSSGVYLINLRINGVSRKTSKMIFVK